VIARKRLGPTATVMHGASVGLGCSRCTFLPDCGGTYQSFDCLHECCHNFQSCKIACPNSHQFGRLVRDSGGFFPSIGALIQHNHVILPLYVPVIHHRYSRNSPLIEPIIGLPTSRVVALRRHFPDLNAVKLRSLFGVRQDARIVLISVAQDYELEKMWRDMRVNDLPGFIGKLGVEHITSPNFSIPDDLPRTEGLVNIARILKASDEFSRARLSVIPHLNATHERQWRNWTSFLREHSHLRFVAKEFQTGLASAQKARWHIAKLLEVQQRIGRGVHLCAIGGRRHMAHMMRLDGLTIIDSSPFLQTVHRQILTFPNGKWVLSRIPTGQMLDGRLAENIEAYRQGIAEKSKGLRNKAVQASRLLVPMEPTLKGLNDNWHSENQGILWPELKLKETA
jgi:hypothetical protein